jgi:hypothetical protein
MSLMGLQPAHGDVLIGEVGRSAQKASLDDKAGATTKWRGVLKGGDRETRRRKKNTGTTRMIRRNGGRP